MSDPKFAVVVGEKEAFAMDEHGALLAAVTLMRERTVARLHGYCCATFYTYEGDEFVGSVDGTELARLANAHLR